MEEAERLLAERMEQVIEEDQSFSVYAYQFDPEEGEVRLLLGIMAYEQAAGKLPEVMDRLLKSWDKNEEAQAASRLAFR